VNRPSFDHLEDLVEASMKRFDWQDLPPTVQRAVEEHCGSVRDASSVDGPRAGLAARVYGTDDEVFIRGIPLRLPEAPRYRQEWEVLKRLPRHAPAPHLLWEVARSGWLIFATELINDHTRRAALKRGSQDLPDVLDAVDRISRIRCPTGIRPLATYVRTMLPMACQLLDEAPGELRGRDLYKTALDGFDLTALDGDRLVHGNLCYRYLLVKGNQVRVVGWREASSGAAWVDGALLAAELIAGGHDPAAGLAAVSALFHLYQARHGHETQREQEQRRAAAGREWLAYLLAKE
jgi:hypothetical protein